MTAQRRITGGAIDDIAEIKLSVNLGPDQSRKRSAFPRETYTAQGN